MQDLHTWDLVRRVDSMEGICPLTLNMTIADFQKMIEECKEIEATPVAATRPKSLSAKAQEKDQLHVLLQKVAPLCPECGKKMTHVTEDMAGRGGPPENSWLCTTPMCGRVLYT
jgi:tRNA(Ile2) C34 agmatinyltransferase TiaS